MTDLESALIEVASALDQIPVPYMLIGGLAVSSWGEARSTLDVDVTIWTEPELLDHTVSEIGKHLKLLPKDLPGLYAELECFRQRVRAKFVLISSLRLFRPRSLSFAARSQSRSQAKL